MERERVTWKEEWMGRERERDREKEREFEREKGNLLCIYSERERRQTKRDNEWERLVEIDGETESGDKDRDGKGEEKS